MANSKNIKWNADWKNKENQSYTIKWRWKVWRVKLVREVEQKKHEWCWIIKVNWVKYVRALQDDSTDNNIDK